MDKKSPPGSEDFTPAAETNGFSHRCVRLGRGLMVPWAWSRGPTDHLLVDMGLATITALADKARSEDLSEKDYNAISPGEGKPLGDAGGPPP